MPDEPTEKPETSTTDDDVELGAEADAGSSSSSTSPVDEMSPEAIAKRVAALGGDDEAEGLAREEELKLAARRAVAKGGKGNRGKAGLEAAATKRLQKVGGKVPPKRIAYAADADALLGSGPFGRWLRENQKGVIGAAVVALVALIGVGGYVWRTQHTESGASTDITLALDDEEGRIGDPAKDDDDSVAAKDPRPLFKTEADRRGAALAKYKLVETQYKGTGAAYLARLEEGSLLLDKPDIDGAIAAFTEASTSPLAAADSEVKGRALEGLGFAYEAKAAATPADKDKLLDQAAQQFRALENTDVKGFKELGMYHQARIAEEKGEKDKAVTLLKSLHERLTAGTPADGHPFVYLEQVADDRLRQLDPTALPPRQKGGGPMAAGGGGAGGKMSEEQIQKILEQLKAQGAAGGSGGGGGAPPGQK